MPDLVVYGSPVSPFGRKVEATLIEKGVEYDFQPMEFFNPTEEFLAISPMRRIPIIRDRTVGTEGAPGTIADSSAICGFLEKRHPDPALYPADPFAYGRALFIEEYADTNLAPVGGGNIFRPILFPILQGKESDVEAARETWREKMPPILNYLESQLEGEFFAGNQISIADIAVTCCLMQVLLVAEIDLSPWPKMAAHTEMMRQRESIAGPFAKAESFARKTVPQRVALD